MQTSRCTCWNTWGPAPALPLPGALGCALWAPPSTRPPRGKSVLVTPGLWAAACAPLWSAAVPLLFLSLIQVTFTEHLWASALLGTGDPAREDKPLPKERALQPRNREARGTREGLLPCFLLNPSSGPQLPGYLTPIPPRILAQKPGKRDRASSHNWSIWWFPKCLSRRAQQAAWTRQTPGSWELQRRGSLRAGTAPPPPWCYSELGRQFLACLQPVPSLQWSKLLRTWCPPVDIPPFTRNERCGGF